MAFGSDAQVRLVLLFLGNILKHMISCVPHIYFSGGSFVDVEANFFFFR